jgi:hypothetical protein
VIANVGTGHLWGSRTTPPILLSYLTSGNAELGAPPDWDVGHFVGMFGRIEGPGGTLVIVGDTYRSLGWEAVHLQPIERFADALARTGSGRASGVVLVVSRDDAEHVEQRLCAAGLEIRTWDNGTPDMANAGS